MILEYLNESADILTSKVMNEEITMEEAANAYVDLEDKALVEYAEEIVDATIEGVLSIEEANLILEMCGIAEDCMLEADYDLSGLSNSERKAVTDKLNSLDPKARKKAEAALVKQYPSKEYLAKKDRRKKILAGVGAAALAGGAIAYGAKKASDNANETRVLNNRHHSKEFEDIYAKRDEEVKKLENDPRFKDLLNSSKGGALGAGAKLRTGTKLPSELLMARDQYDDEVNKINNKFSGDLYKTLQKEKEQEGYKKRFRDEAKALKQEEKYKKVRNKKLAAYNKLDEEYLKGHKLGAIGRRLKSAGSSILNAPTKISNAGNEFLGNTDKVKELKHKETGFFKKGIEKRSKERLDKATSED